MTFWLDNWEGTAKGGIFIRNDLFKFMKTLKEQDYKGGRLCLDSF